MYFERTSVYNSPLKKPGGLSLLETKISKGRSKNKRIKHQRKERKKEDQT